ncbi:Uncharacterised protein [Mycobacteroides abscessus subsp. abscessus]|nr:Uncharacterised protein [Mycobacteroides abscessus subsp. abscessus]
MAVRFSQFCSLCVILSTRRYYSAQPTDPSIASASLPVLNEDSVRSVAVLVNRTSVGGGVRALSVVGHVTGSPLGCRLGTLAAQRIWSRRIPRPVVADACHEPYSKR